MGTQDIWTNGYLFSGGCWTAAFTNHEEGKKEASVWLMWQGGDACSGICGRPCYLHQCRQYLKLKIWKLWLLLDLSPALPELYSPALSMHTLFPVPGVPRPPPFLSLVKPHSSFKSSQGRYRFCGILSTDCSFPSSLIGLVLSLIHI